jgi:flagellar hook-length control protein FliK
VDAKPEVGIESVLSSALPSLEGGLEGVKKLLRPQSDSEPALPEAAASVPLMASLINAPMLQDAAVSVAVNSSESALKGKAGVAQQAKSESISSTNSNSAPGLILARVGDEVGTKSVVTAKTDELLKSHAAENAADAGQGLPSLTSARQADSSRFSVEVKPEARIESVLSSTLSSLEGRRVDSDAPESIIVTQAFERVLSQVESKINVSIEAPVRSAAFTSELADKVVWLSGRQGQLADLLLNPPEMGTLEVRLTVSGGDASAQFYSPNPVVRDAIDAALPKLRELMAQAGISLGEAEVRDQAFSQRENLEMQGRRTARSTEINPQPSALAAIGVVKSAGLGLVDLYI